MVTEWLWRWMVLFVFGMEYGFEILSKRTTIDITILMRKECQKIIIAQVKSIWRFRHTHTKKWNGIVSILSIIFSPISEFIPLTNAKWQQIFIWLRAHSIQHFAICYVIGNVYDDDGCSAFSSFVPFRFYTERYFVF